MSPEIQFPNILLTAFRGSSAELVISDTSKYKILLLPNDKVKDSEKLIEVISNEKIDYVISLGQKPNIKDKVHIETTARAGEFCINTNYDCTTLKRLFEQNGLVSKISHNAGTSFCNQLYLNGLKYLYQNASATKILDTIVDMQTN